MDFYQFLTNDDDVIRYEVTNIIWNKEVSLKVTSFDWRLLQNKIPLEITYCSDG